MDESPPARWASMVSASALHLRWALDYARLLGFTDPYLAPYLEALRLIENPATGVLRPAITQGTRP